MYNNHLLQWLLFFYIYCFLGWVIESTIVSVSSKKIVNRGFLRGPFLPLYGFGALLILLITLPIKENIISVYISGVVGATILEYITGWLMEVLFKMKYWDYTGHKWQLHGRICLRSSLFWGVLSVVLVNGVHKPIERFVVALSPIMIIVMVFSITVIMGMDTIYSIHTALDLNKLLAHMTRIRTEIEGLRKQMGNHEGSLAHHELVALRKKVSKLKEEYRSLISKIDGLKSRLIMAHPSGYSVRFNEAFKDIKSKLVGTTEYFRKNSKKK